MAEKKRVPRVPSNLGETSLIYIGDNHYVEPTTGMVLSRVGHIGMYGYEKAEHNGQRAASVHRLVYEAVHGSLAEGLMVNHINGDRADNLIENLEALTCGENNAHGYRSGGRDRVAPHVQGERHPNAKVSDAQAEEIRERATDGERVPDLAAEYGLSIGHTYKIARARIGGRAQYGTWDRPKTRARRKVTANQEAEIQKRVAAGERAADLAVEYGISPVSVNAIARAANGPRRLYKVPEQTAAEIVRRAAAGESAQALATDLGLGMSTVKRIKRQARRAAHAEPD
ncbi:HNH endonuclease [Streptomyces sp. NPDC055692]|uniref:HNH endonuclease n=1 Tax=Streptomyces sp. NPDC055692 TaxID=3155683 RepID=UPI0034326DC3